MKHMDMKNISVMGYVKKQKVPTRPLLRRRLLKQSYNQKSIFIGDSLENEPSSKKILKRDIPIITGKKDIKPEIIYREEDIEKGKKTFLLVAGTIFVIQLLSLLLTIAYEKNVNSIFSENVNSSIDPIEYIALCIFLVVMYNGKFWAQIVSFIWILFSVLANIFTIVFSYALDHYSETTVLVFIEAALVICLVILMVNKKITCFIGYQRKIDKGKLIRVILKNGEAVDLNLDPDEKATGLELYNEETLLRKSHRGKRMLFVVIAAVMAFKIIYLTSAIVLQKLFKYDLGLNNLDFTGSLIGLIVSFITLFYLYRGVVWFQYFYLVVAGLKLLLFLGKFEAYLEGTVVLGYLILDLMVLFGLWIMTLLIFLSSDVKLFLVDQKVEHQ